MILYVLSGLPGSGKSTRCRELSDNHGYVMVCRDELRASYRNITCEGQLSWMLFVNARSLLSMGHSVVVDAWNLHLDDEMRWKEIAAETGATLTWEHMGTPVDLCVARDATRPNPNGEGAVRWASVEYAERLVQLGG